MCALLSTVRTLRHVPRPGNLLPMLDKRWVAAALNRESRPVVRLPSPGGLPTALLHALPAPHTPLRVADIANQAGLPEAPLQVARLCMAAAEGGTSLCLSPCSASRMRCRRRGRMPPNRGRSTPGGGCVWRTWRPPTP